MNTKTFIKAFNKAFSGNSSATETKDGFEIKIDGTVSTFDEDGSLVACLKTTVKKSPTKSKKVTPKSKPTTKKPKDNDDDDDWDLF